MMFNCAITGNDIGFALATCAATAEIRRVYACGFGCFQDALMRADFNLFG